MSEATLERDMGAAPAKNPLAPTANDIKMLLAAQAHIGTRNCLKNMAEYIHGRAKNGVYLFNLAKTWEKIQLAARILVAIENPEDIVIVSARPFGQRAAFKLAKAIGATFVSKRYTPGSFTNTVCRDFKEPRVLLVTDPISDKQAISEAAYVLRMRGDITRDSEWDTVVDLFIYKDIEEIEREAKEKSDLEKAEKEQEREQSELQQFDEADALTEEPVAATEPAVAQDTPVDWVEMNK